jgi:hypothetical protein
MPTERDFNDTGRMSSQTAANLVEGLRLMDDYRKAWRTVEEWKRTRQGDEPEPDEVRAALDFIVTVFNIDMVEGEFSGPYPLPDDVGNRMAVLERQIDEQYDRINSLAAQRDLTPDDARLIERVHDAYARLRELQNSRADMLSGALREVIPMAPTSGPSILDEVQGIIDVVSHRNH